MCRWGEAVLPVTAKTLHHRAMKLMLVLLAIVCLPPARAAAQPHAFEGEWIWDKAAYVPPPGMAAMTHMVAETMSVSRDDGVHYTGRIHQVFDNGAVTDMDEDFAEDGRDHPVHLWESVTMMVRMVALPDGGRRVVSSRDGEAHESLCHVSDGGRTLTCTGTHKQADGSAGDYVCVYHRDPYMIPVSFLAPHRAGALG